MSSINFEERASGYLGQMAAGGSSGLPEVSGSDNGKVLKVVNGAWDKAEASGGGNDYLVEFTLTPGSGDNDPTTVTTQTSVDTIIAAITAGKNVRCKATMSLAVEGDEGSYLENNCFGDLTSYYIQYGNDENYVKYLLFNFYDYAGESMKPWRLSGIAGGTAVESGTPSGDMWMFIPWVKD